MTTMRNAEEMKVRFAQQTHAHNHIRGRDVDKMFRDWVKVLDAYIDAAFEESPDHGSVPVDTVSASANRFDSPSPGQDRAEIEILAADLVINHFMDRGFNAFRHLMGSTPHQRVEVTWAIR